MKYDPFICPKCGGSHFGSVTKDVDGAIFKVAELCHDEFQIGCNYRNEFTEPVQITTRKRSEDARNNQTPK